MYDDHDDDDDERVAMMIEIMLEDDVSRCPLEENPSQVLSGKKHSRTAGLRIKQTTTQLQAASSLPHMSLPA